MDLAEIVAAEIRAEMGRQRLTGRALASDLGWPPMYLSRRLSGRIAFNLDDVEAVAAVLEVPVTALFGFRGADAVNGQGQLRKKLLAVAA